MDRKYFLQVIAAFAAVSTPIKRILSLGSVKDACRTDSDIQGPFYRARVPFRKDIAAHYKGDGISLEVSGVIYGSDCKTPLPDAIVDVWHAGPKGDYDNEGHRYLFRGRIKTNKSGQYKFKTLMPGAYTDAGLDRPKHIHFKVRAKGYDELTTQMYFENDPFLSQDVFVQKNNGLKRTVKVRQGTSAKLVDFDLYL